MIPLLLLGVGLMVYTLPDEDKNKPKRKGLGAVKIKNTPIPSYVLATMPQEVINYIAKNFNQVFGSPYSNSYYSESGQSWDYTPPNQIRVANHWNFYSRDYNDPFSIEKLHAETDTPVKNNTHWTIARKENGIYKVIISLPVVSKVKQKNYSYDLLSQKEPNQILYKFKEKVDRQKRIDALKKKEASKLKTISIKSLESKINKLNITKSSIVYGLIKSLLNKETVLRPVYSQGKGRNTTTVDRSDEVKRILEQLNLRFSISNDAPRGGKTGYRIDILTKIK